MNIDFIKGHGTENDFVVIIDTDDVLDLATEQVAELCERRRGIGADGLLRVVRHGDTWFMDYRNADGSVAEMCGNGIRLFSHVLVTEGLEQSRNFIVDTRAGRKQIQILEAGPAQARVAVDMGEVTVLGLSTARLGTMSIAGLAIDVGNPHLAAVIPGLTAGSLAAMELEEPEVDQDFFPGGVNVEVLTELDEGAVHMRVWERGVGETRSCGTGTVAAARAALADAGIENGAVNVHVPGGVVSVEIRDDQATMTGPSRIVAHGTITMPSVSS